MKIKKIATFLSLCGVAAAGAVYAAPLQIALVETLSGPQASTGLMFRAGLKYQVDKINAAGGWNGEPLVVVDYDNQGGPAGASDKVKAAIAAGAQIFVQGASSAVAGQITEDIRKHNLRNPGKELLFLNVGGEALELTGDKCHFYHFRFATNAQMRVKTLVSAMKESNELGTKVYGMNQNYSWGIDMDKSIKDFAGAGGYTVVDSTLHDVNKIQDFSPYVAKIKASGAETVLTGSWSNDLLLLMKSTNNAGLKVRFGTVFLDQVGNLANAGDNAVGHYISHPFNIEANGKKTEEFAEEYKAKTGHYPSFVEPQTAFATQMFGDALKTVKAASGKLNIKELALALEKVKTETPMGLATIRNADHQVMLPMVVSKVTKDAKYKADGTDMGFKVIKRFTAEESINPVQSSCKMERPV